MNDNTKNSSAGFYGLGIAPKLLSALDALKFETPTPIQAKAIPPALEGKDVVGIAQTGTGKTIAFAIPMLQRLAALTGKGLVLVPTRELALQVHEVFKKFAPLMGMQTSVIIGGEAISRQQQDLRKKPRVIIATPGRLIDHMQHRTVRLDDACVLVLDEADRMFDMGFAPQINRILEGVPKERQTMLFSATMPDSIMKLAAARMKLPLRVEVARPGTAIEKTKQEVFMVSKAEKAALLTTILGQYGGSVLLFVRTKRSAHRIVQNIRDSGYNAAEIHSNRSLNQRREALDGFKSGRYRVLVATDIAARGIDVIGIELVINYDLPDENENYVHRIGRTGRAGQPGHAISFATPDQRGDLKAIERLLRTIIPVSTLPKLTAAVRAPVKLKPPAAQLNSQAHPAPTPRPCPARASAQNQFPKRAHQQQSQPRPFGPGIGAERPTHNPTHQQTTPKERGGNFRFTAPSRRPDFNRGGRPAGPGPNPRSFAGPPSRSPGGSRVEVSPYFDEPRRPFRAQAPRQDYRGHTYGERQAARGPQRGGTPAPGRWNAGGPPAGGRRARGQGQSKWQAQQPGQAQPKKPVPVSWFARFIKKKKDDFPD
ncbi:MAG: hypothetical protein A2021_04235 [Elusimicrobia bacterium GWF2_52_66]|nr:MAG: hypothetical protein A2X33_04060 [Elusimicrobia bacterium GWA2_51_34]OGR85928.1 MAG: hypothetical protein A2021_04235 [Elusimicrobia bacterium GWF2_52_66]